MYSMDDLLHLIHSDGADKLCLHVGEPPTVVVDNERHLIEGPAITPGDAEQLFMSIANTRQRRELRESGVVSFMYRFRNCAEFVVQAKLERGGVGIDIH